MRLIAVGRDGGDHSFAVNSQMSDQFIERNAAQFYRTVEVGVVPNRIGDLGQTEQIVVTNVSRLRSHSGHRKILRGGTLLPQRDAIMRTAAQQHTGERCTENQKDSSHGVILTDREPTRERPERSMRAQRVHEISDTRQSLCFHGPGMRPHYNDLMSSSSPPLAALLDAYKTGAADPVTQTRVALSRVNGNLTRNTYIVTDPQWSLHEAELQAKRAASAPSSLPLAGVPVSLKDCFDLSGFPTSCGSKFYASHHGSVAQDSWVAARLRARGAVIVGKTHLHQLAYGITGENPDYGDCLQPLNPALLTGGSSSGAAASIQEGSAVAAIGTDTGGSVRTPAALCGLAGYRSSLGLGDWTGGHHLAPSFDTIGWLFRDLRDAFLLGDALFDLPAEKLAPTPIRVGVLAGSLLEDCDQAVCASLFDWRESLLQAGVRVEPVEPAFWFDAWDIYAPIQAAEAAQIHAGFFDNFDPLIGARLRWGAQFNDQELSQWQNRLRGYRAQLQQLLMRFDFILAPATPASRLPARADHAKTRAAILRHTAPASLGGLPAVVLPSDRCGVQLMAAHNDDRRLLRLAVQLGELVAGE